MNMSEKCTIAVMQPTFLPWLGYFDLIDQANIFVFLDDVGFSKQSWHQRNRIKTANGVIWLTVPVLTRGSAEQRINEVKINLVSNDREKHLKTIIQAYKKAPFYKSYIDELSEILNRKYVLLVDLNIDLINLFCKSMNIKTNLIKSSQLTIQGHKVDRLINICKTLNADVYLSTPGSKAYIDENNLFIPNHIDLKYHDYKHPLYNQLHGEFVPYLSVLDLLFCEGQQSMNIIRSGRNSRQVTE